MVGNFSSFSAPSLKISDMKKCQLETQASPNLFQITMSEDLPDDILDKIICEVLQNICACIENDSCNESLTTSDVPEITFDAANSESLNESNETVEIIGVVNKSKILPENGEHQWNENALKNTKDTTLVSDESIMRTFLDNWFSHLNMYANFFISKNF